MGRVQVSLQTPGDGSGVALRTNSEGVLAAAAAARHWALRATPGTRPSVLMQQPRLGPLPQLGAPRKCAVQTAKLRHTMWGLLQVCSTLDKIGTLFEKFYLKTWGHNRGSRMMTGILLPGFSSQKPGLSSSGCYYRYQDPSSLSAHEGCTLPGPLRFLPPPPLPISCV